jgi:outer membrane biosynthesis protein TonB
MFVLRFQAHLISTRTLAALALGLALLLAGCQKKPIRIIPAVLAPAIETQPQPSPSQNPPDENPGTTPETSPADTQQLDPQKPKPKPRKPIVHKPAQPTTQPAPAVVETPKPEPQKPTTPDHSVQITADVPRAAVQSQKQNTENLLRNSEGRLGQINRNLSESEQGMLRQARNYITQSNQALQGGDVERAYNLAVKANLLANELAK